MNRTSAGRFATTSDPGACSAISEASTCRVVWSASVRAWSAFTKIRLGKSWVTGFRLTASKLRSPEIMVVGAPPPP